MLDRALAHLGASGTQHRAKVFNEMQESVPCGGLEGGKLGRWSHTHTQADDASLTTLCVCTVLGESHQPTST